MNDPAHFWFEQLCCKFDN